MHRSYWLGGWWDSSNGVIVAWSAEASRAAAAIVAHRARVPGRPCFQRARSQQALERSARARGRVSPAGLPAPPARRRARRGDLGRMVARPRPEPRTAGELPREDGAGARLGGVRAALLRGD